MDSGALPLLSVRKLSESPAGPLESHWPRLGHSATSRGKELIEISLQLWASQVALAVKNMAANAGDIKDSGSIPGSGRSPGGGLGHPLQYFCWENPMDRQVEPGGLQSTGSQRVGHDRGDSACMHAPQAPDACSAVTFSKSLSNT